jgi:hypothetical protein
VTRKRASGWDVARRLHTGNTMDGSSRIGDSVRTATVSTVANLSQRVRQKSVTRLNGVFRNELGAPVLIVVLGWMVSRGVPERVSKDATAKLSQGHASICWNSQQHLMIYFS